MLHTESEDQSLKISRSTGKISSVDNRFTAIKNFVAISAKMKGMIIQSYSYSLYEFP